MSSVIEPPRRGAWGRVMPVFLRSAPEPLMRALRRRTTVPFDELVVTGRRSGVDRAVLLTIADVEGRWYISHPDGGRADWVENLRATPESTLVRVSGQRTAVRAVELARGSERSAAIDALVAVQQPPASFVYRAARRHIEAQGQVFRLDPAEA
jgi:hypothetical protein